ncbi:TPA: hypothetical protein U8214_000486 [Pseudomonas putida]|jgi:hypothetical protein|uniref:hypothetical protein n=1 Tax=Pseudomonas sp. Marseille-P9655 TaxID=2866591 RepID=UPI001CE4310A|nr:hypothetical protein [Pseudomonas sp. Marseille-P9655]HEN8726638.1 hypothetical protein [Pseudomonas putida]
MQLDINIEGIVAESVAAALSPGKLQPIIEKNVESTVKRAIEEQFSYSSPFKKLLEEKLAAVMPTDVQDIGRYGDLVLKTVSSYLENMQNQAVKQTIEEKLTAMLKPLPARMTLTELVKQITKAFEDRSDVAGEEGPSIIIEKSEGVCDGYWQLYADAEQNKDKWSCSVKMMFRSDGECFDLTVNEYDPKKSLYLGATYGIEALLLNIYTGGVKIDFEEIDTYDVRYSHSDY